MSKSYRKEVLKRLQQELDATTDTKEIIRISNAIAKLTPRPKPRRARKASSAPAGGSGSSSRFTEPTGTALDKLSPGQRVIHHLVLLAETKCKGRGGWGVLTRPEKDAIIEEVKASLSDGERQLAESYVADGAQAAEQAEGLKGC